MKRQFEMATVMVAIMVLSILAVLPVMSGLDDEKMNSAPDRSCLYCDITGDSINDVLVRVTTYDPDTDMPTRTDIKAVNGSNGKELWNESYKNCLADAIPAGDLNGDNKLDVVINLVTCVDPSSYKGYGKVIGVNGCNGKKLWNETKPEGEYGVMMIGNPANLTSANRTDVIVNTMTFTLSGPRTDIMAIKGSNGKRLWEEPFTTNSMVFGVPVDLNNDGKDEVVIGLPEEKATSLVTEGFTPTVSNVIAVYGNNGTMFWNSKDYPDVATFEPAGDLTGNGANDLMVWIGCCRLEAINGSNGQELWNKSMT